MASPHRGVGILELERSINSLSNTNSMVYPQQTRTFYLGLRPGGNEVRSNFKSIASNWHVENGGCPCDLPHKGAPVC